MDVKVGVLGGGASGLMAAMKAATDGAKVTILESKDRIGKKLLMTGNGKCNLSNLSFSIDNYYSDELDKVERAFLRFGVTEAVEYFEDELGLLIKDKNGYLYPNSEQASSVLDMFRMKLKYLEVKIVTEAKVLSIQKGKDFNVRTEAGSFHFDRIIIACGGKAVASSGSDGSGYKLVKSMGHKVIEPVPALTALKSSETYFKAVSGVRMEVKCKLYIDDNFEAEDTGELQLTDYGVSGIPIFQISRFAALALKEKKAVTVVIDSLPRFKQAQWRNMWGERLSRFAYRTWEEMLNGVVPKKVALLFIKMAGCKPLEKVGDTKDKNKLILGHLLKEWRIEIQATNPFTQAQVCAGGIPMIEIKDDFESTLVPLMYVTGELLNVDGKCGGYNLQWAWTSGYLAGQAAAK